MARPLAALIGVLALLAQASPAWATWSIVAVDRTTGRSVMALATCAYIDAHFLSSMTAVVAPGKGIAACQAAVDAFGGDQKLILEGLRQGRDPAAILAELARSPAFARRQFGIVDLKGRSAGATGRDDPPRAGQVRGKLPGAEIYYSIQGNTLTTDQLVPAVQKAFAETPGALTDRVMAALEAGDRAGGDSRCVCGPNSLGAAMSPPCDNAHSQVAFILMSEPGDPAGPTSIDVRPAMYISVSPPGPARRNDDQINLLRGDSPNPVKTLRRRYDVWRKAQPASFR